MNVTYLREWRLRKEQPSGQLDRADHAHRFHFRCPVCGQETAIRLLRRGRGLRNVWLRLKKKRMYRCVECGNHFPLRSDEVFGKPVEDSPLTGAENFLPCEDSKSFPDLIQELSCAEQALESEAAEGAPAGERPALEVAHLAGQR